MVRPTSRTTAANLVLLSSCHMHTNIRRKSFVWYAIAAARHTPSSAQRLANSSAGKPAADTESMIEGVNAWCTTDNFSRPAISTSSRYQIYPKRITRATQNQFLALHAKTFSRLRSYDTFVHGIPRLKNVAKEIAAREWQLVKHDIEEFVTPAWVNQEKQRAEYLTRVARAERRMGRVSNSLL